MDHEVQNMTVTYPCILMQMSSNDVDRVEIYRSGSARSVGVQSNPNGLILVYRIRR